MKPVFRFAPSPNGRLHLGHAYSALLNQRMARACGGRLLLRIEDIDVTRCTPEFEAAIYSDLEWLGGLPVAGRGIYSHFQSDWKINAAVGCGDHEYCFQTIFYYSGNCGCLILRRPAYLF